VLAAQLQGEPPPPRLSGNDGMAIPPEGQAPAKPACANNCGGKVDARILHVRYTHRPNGIIRLIGAAYWREGHDYDENHWKNQIL